jgi:hypothetical protein
MIYMYTHITIGPRECWFQAFWTRAERIADVKAYTAKHDALGLLEFLMEDETFGECRIDSTLSLAEITPPQKAKNKQNNKHDRPGGVQTLLSWVRQAKGYAVLALMMQYLHVQESVQALIKALFGEVENTAN